MTLVVHSPASSIMAEHQPTGYELGEMPINTEGSLRSRASSVISTGTKFSISTMPQGLYHIDGIVEGASSRNVATRPGSIYSIRSLAPSLPPYEGHQPMDSSQTVTNDSNDLEQPSTPLDSENANALSRHYGRVVRTIDENHARQLERIYRGHEQQLAETRDAIDRAYRVEFKKKDQEVEQIREEVAATVASLENEIKTLETTHEETMALLQQEAADQTANINDTHKKDKEKACHAIEDVWEGRWNDSKRLAAEEAQRRDLERDREWLGVLQATHPEIVDEMKDAIELVRTK